MTRLPINKLVWRHTYGGLVCSAIGPYKIFQPPKISFFEANDGLAVRFIVRQSLFVAPHLESSKIRYWNPRSINLRINNGYYRRFVNGFSSIPAPLTKLTQKAAKFQWIEACEHSFQELKDRLTSSPVLSLPYGSEGYAVYCDASGVGLGCVLMQHSHMLQGS
ncbi:hypothetical protein MTR67_023177 [Solanum verrucosum]|uniref:Reverse transcriptase/retrotransposon-derived protein RNase H-like domain-containing protein n=1 Tax=Solanum verrucosum TaxID=315347 RepID=A0AAF0QWA3_SOLVR|nr:hypothetical protein MTR67_023177 [Solanum verrucosum]